MTSQELARAATVRWVVNFRGRRRVFTFRAFAAQHFSDDFCATSSASAMGAEDLRKSGQCSLGPRAPSRGGRAARCAQRYDPVIEAVTIHPHWYSQKRCGQDWYRRMGPPADLRCRVREKVEQRAVPGVEAGLADLTPGVPGRSEQSQECLRHSFDTRSVDLEMLL